MSTPIIDELDQEFIDSFRSPASAGNRIRDLNPISFAVIMVACAVAAVTLPGPWGPAAICLIYVAVSIAAGVSKAFLPAYGKLFAVVGLILFVLRAAFLPGEHVLLRLGPIAISAEGIAQGLDFALVVMALCGAMTLFFTVTPMKNLMLALELRGVTPRATYVILASFQAITDLGKNTKVVMDAQKSRGIETEGGMVGRVTAFVPILAPVFLAAMSQTEERALALDARAFNSRSRHSYLVSLQPVGAAEIALVCAVAACAVLSIVGAAFIWN
ncbi:energy-coupling factor transporter transmembrane protein EcfT [Arthrobacter silviterrae]|uniref:Energy-coupling factor transporter transmembrane protein EcfT n=1 Tax=Arthrobacter silviterrae TaxID=2026658 RepID=A0ABX0DH02_9MICC|nr:energy-coupling factor transporter transmembrane component T [Arthrobacter silviterrae]MDQ0276477.1 energy-coupling factor transporter transmembrane protein EcfT [Arthrobacter silviterrae]NGN84685.1 energy-coupling factor transporter transmembrane protein EcfT [Arthrobacter silviterrae]